jgi:ATP-dependent DNA helicase RecG
MNAHTRRDDALAAIDAVTAGAVAHTVETERIDFKEEAGSVSSDGTRRPIDPQYEPAAAALAAEAACMANSESGGVLIVGVDDKRAGLSAFVGTHLDITWLRRRIHALTQPSLSIDEIEIHERANARLYLINVAPALEEVRCGGKLRTRYGTECVELTGDRARQFLEQRRAYDWSAEASGMRFSDATDAALASARTHYRAAHGTAPGSDLEIVRRMGGVVTDADPDPELTRAAALLLCRFEPDIEQIQLLVTLSEGAPSRRSVRGPAPLLPLFDEAWSVLADEAFTPTSRLIGVQRRSLRTISERALREALMNAIMHRDYRLPRAAVVAMAIGSPADVLKVRSPGGFPYGVPADRLIACPSRPRNPALAQALRVLGLAEREGVGVDTMYEVMLRDGHSAPAIGEDGGDVLVLLRGGTPDLVLREFFSELATATGRADDEDDLRVTIAVTELTVHPVLRPERLAEAAQCTHAEAMRTLEQLESAGSVERLLNGGRSFRLGALARATLGTRLGYRSYRALDEHGQLVEAYFDSRPEIGRDDAVALLGLSTTSASRVLSALAKAGAIEAVSNRRGAGVRYRRATG